MSRIVIAAIFACLFFSCDNDKPSTTDPAPTTEPTPPAAATLPSVPLELLQRIYREGTQLDYIYHYHPFTASLSEKGAIQNAIRHVAEAPAPLNPNCKPAGLVTYQIDGDMVLRADFYFETDCTYFVFYDKDDNKYSNYMTQDGVNFFNTQIQQALKLREKAQQ